MKVDDLRVLEKLSEFKQSVKQVSWEKKLGKQGLSSWY